MLRLLRPSSELDLEQRTGGWRSLYCVSIFWGASHLTNAKVLTAVLETASNAAGASLLKIFLQSRGDSLE